MRKISKQKRILKQSKKVACTAGQRWGPRASARGNQDKRGENRKECGKSPSKKEFSNKAGKLHAPRGSGGALAQARGETLQKRGNPAKKGKPANRGKEPQAQGHGWGPRASARGNPAKKGKPCKKGETVKQRKRAAGTRARLGPSRKREGKTGEKREGESRAGKRWSPRASARGDSEFRGEAGPGRAGVPGTCVSAVRPRSGVMEDR